MKSGIAMVRINGTKIRSLREEQNLTQLYLATAVGVTTETISRWERKKSPTIKEENGLKLAEALAVSLEEIICHNEREDQGSVGEEKRVPVRLQINRWIIVIACIMGLALCALFFLFFQENESLSFSAKRIMPSHGTFGHPFPVVISVESASGRSSSLLLKEQLPDGCQVLATSPVAAVVSTGFIKWVEKQASEGGGFSYTASCKTKQQSQERFSFEGTLLVRQSSRQESPVKGSSQYELSVFHWADSNRDNTIDDEELLAVYDDYSSAEGLLDGMEEVESLWMGSAYRWNGKGLVFEVVP